MGLWSHTDHLAFAGSLESLQKCEEEVKLDVQWVFNQAYDRGSYSRGAVDYGGAPEPPLEAEDVHWLQPRLRAYKLRS